jgi:CDP-diacylglycerol--serine O-phosphatidyltransferase
MKINQILNIPNLFTLFNLFFGCLGVVFCFFPAYIQYVPYTTAASLVMDFLDGFAARYFKMTTNIGKELDSLADMVSFGFLPGTVLFFLAKEGMGIYIDLNDILWKAMPLYTLTLFAALRLAKFNVDDRQSDSFRGLATPACTIFIIGLLSMHLDLSPAYASIDRLITSLPFLYILTLLLSILMLSDIRLFSFKSKGFVLKGNRTKLVFAFSSLLLLVFLGSMAWSLIIIIYILLSIFRHYFPNDLFSRN